MGQLAKETHKMTTMLLIADFSDVIPLKSRDYASAF